MNYTKSSIRILFLATVGLYLGSCSSASVKTADGFEIVELPDASMVYLNRHSSLEYNTDFDPRVVTLTGEAFFMVTHDDTPFVVQTNAGEIKVLGTEFNVKASDEEVSLEVRDGEVELDAGESVSKVGKGKAAFYKEDGKGIRNSEAKYEYDVWMKEMKIEFKKMGKEIKEASKEVGKESKKLGKEIKKEWKKLNKK